MASLSEYFGFDPNSPYADLFSKIYYLTKVSPDDPLEEKEDGEIIETHEMNSIDAQITVESDDIDHSMGDVDFHAPLVDETPCQYPIPPKSWTKGWMKQQSLEDINTKIKQLKDERLKREQDLNLNEEELLKKRQLELLKMKRELKSQDDRNASTSTTCLQSKGKKGRKKQRSLITVEKDESQSISKSALKFFTRRLHQPKQRSPSVPRPVMERLGPIVSVKSRLGNTSRGTGEQCQYCGEADHANVTFMERQQYCAAFGRACSYCGKMNHLAKMCKKANIDANNNN